MNNITNQIAFLPTSREFPEDLNRLSTECNRSYLDIANAVNSRTIGIYAVGKSSITGNDYFLTSKKSQSVRRAYTFTSTSDLNIGFKISTISQFVQMYGVYTSGTATFGLIAGTNVTIAGQILFYIDVNGASTMSDVIKFVVGAGAPALSSGIIVIEWLSDL